MTWSYNYTPSNTELYHYGVPGMKWGHKKMAQYYTKQYNKNKQAAKELSISSKTMKNPVYKAYQKDAAKASREAANHYKAKAAKHAALGKTVVSKSSKKSYKDLINKSMTTKQMAEAGYFGLIGKKLVKK